MQMDKIAIIGCGKSKRDKTSPAGDLYTSGFFTLKSDWAEAHTDEQWILSAKHGLVHRSVRIEPYDLTPDDPEFDAEHWARRVERDLKGIVRMADPEEIVILAGSSYTDHIDHILDAAPVEFTFPLSGMGIGEQQAWLSDRV